MERLLDAVFLGLSAGSIYSLVALGLVVVFRGTGHLNFAAGEMATLCAYITWVVTTWTLFGVSGLPLWLATLAGMAFGFALGAATEVFIVSPLSKKSPLAVFVALIAILLGINALDVGRWGAPPSEEIDSLFPNEPDDFVRVFGAVWRWEDIGTLIVVLVTSALLFLLFGKTKVGLAMRAVASNSESSRLVGVPTKLVLMGSWGLSGALGALAGVMVAGAQAQVTPTMMFTIFVYASAAATLGGLDSPIGAVVGGLSIGVVENVAAEYAPGVDRPGDEAVRRPPVHLRRAVRQAVWPVRHRESRTGLSAMPLKVHWGSAWHWAIRLLWVAATVAFVLYIPTRTQVSTINDMTIALELVAVAMALNLVMGYGGIVSLGHSFYFGLGAYTMAVLVDHYGWSQGWTLYVAAVFGFVAGCLTSLPALRLKGVYLALTSIGLAVLFPQLDQVAEAGMADRRRPRHRRPAVRRDPGVADPRRAARTRRAGRVDVLARRHRRRPRLPRVSRHREESRRPVVDRHPRQRDGCRRDGCQPPADADDRLRALGGDHRHRRRLVRHQAQRRQP